MESTDLKQVGFKRELITVRDVERMPEYLFAKQVARSSGFSTQLLMMRSNRERMSTTSAAVGCSFTLKHGGFL